MISLKEGYKLVSQDLMVNIIKSMGKLDSSYF